MTTTIDKLKLHATVPIAFKWMLRLMTVFGAASLGLVIYGLYFESPFIRYQNLPFPVETPVEQGRSVPITIERCNDSKDERVYMSARTLKNIDSGKETILPESTVSLKPGCMRNTSRSIIIPLETVPGNYIIEGESITQGLIKKHRVEWYTEQFQVIPITGETKNLIQSNKGAL